MVNKPNILLIVVDCLRSDRVSGPGRSAQVPQLQKLMDQGSFFPNLITANSMTTPCMTSMFSGLYPHTHGVRAINYARVGDDVPLIAEILRDNGYHTYAETTGPVGPHTHLDRGFTRYEKREGVAESFLGEWGERFIDRFRNKEMTGPWFTYLHLWEVHMPRQVRPRFDSPEFGHTRYDRAISGVDERLGQLFEALDDDVLIILTGDHGEKTAETGVESGLERLKSPFVHFYRTTLRHKLGTRGRQLYKKTVDSLKSQWISTARTLHRQGIIDDPLRSLTGHGFHVYDSLVRVPFIVSGYTGFPEGLVINDQVRQIDMMPTILDMAGLSDQIPDDIDGRSLTPMLEGEALTSLPAFIETCKTPSKPSDLYGVRTPDWKYAHHMSDATVADELYDLTADPGEKMNIAEAQPDKVSEMRTLLTEHLQSPQRQSVLLSDDLGQDELKDLTRHLEKLGYIE